MNHPHSRRAKFHNVELREMTKDEVNLLLQRATQGALGTVGDDGPYITPLAFVYHNDYIYFHCHKEGKKLSNIKNDSRVCFQVDISSPDTLNYESIIFKGKAKRIEDEDELFEAMNAMSRKYGGDEKKGPKTGAAMAKIIKVFKVADYIMSSKFSRTI